MTVEVPRPRLSRDLTMLAKGVLPPHRVGRCAPFPWPGVGDEDGDVPPTRPTSDAGAGSASPDAHRRATR